MLILNADSILIINQEVPLLTSTACSPTPCLSASNIVHLAVVLFLLNCMSASWSLSAVAQLSIVFVVRMCFIFHLNSCISSSHVAIVIDAGVFNVFFFILI